jgi:hypothetical protein
MLPAAHPLAGSPAGPSGCARQCPQTHQQQPGRSPLQKKWQAVWTVVRVLVCKFAWCSRCTTHLRPACWRRQAYAISCQKPRLRSHQPRPPASQMTEGCLQVQGLLIADPRTGCSSTSSWTGDVAAPCWPGSDMHTSESPLTQCAELLCLLLVTMRGVLQQFKVPLCPLRPHTAQQALHLAGQKRSASIIATYTTFTESWS